MIGWPMCCHVPGAVSVLVLTPEIISIELGNHREGHPALGLNEN